MYLSDPCEIDGCNAPYNLGCTNIDGEAVCICPTCEDTIDSVCSSDDVQDRNLCEVKRQSCLVGKEIQVVQPSPCGKFSLFKIKFAFVYHLTYFFLPLLGCLFPPFLLFSLPFLWYGLL